MLLELRSKKSLDDVEEKKERKNVCHEKKYAKNDCKKISAKQANRKRKEKSLKIRYQKIKKTVSKIFPFNDETQF